MYLLNFYFLLAAIIICLFARALGDKLAIKLNLFFLLLFNLLNFILFYETSLGSVVEVNLFTWVSLLDLRVNFSLFYDLLSCSMLTLVGFISFLVHIYSYSYMSGDPSKVRFFCYLSFFTFFMALLVVSDSLIQLFFAWEGVGISSYLLINFWYTRYEANRAALKAVFINRFGDFGLYTGIILFIVYFKTQSISAINLLSSEFKGQFSPSLNIFGYEVELMVIIGFFIFLGVVGKSAQLGLHTWLPDAMEGPTPVSALLHAATMVTAGVYLVLRLSFFFEVSGIMFLIAFWGAMTAFFASTVGAFQNDIKKIIAYSTCSQLGYMLAACGLYNFAGAYFHLFNHAFFKALLFLGAGSIIHSIGDEQDLRKFGGLLNFLPFTHITLLVASASLMGLPFFSGFYSKDLIINWTYVCYGAGARAIYFFLLIAAFFTTYYSLKIVYYSFYSTPRFSFFQLRNISESSLWMKIPMLLLTFFALFSGYLFWEVFVAYGNSAPTNVVTYYNYSFLLEFISQKRKFAPFFIGLIAIIVFFLLNFFYRYAFFSLLLRREAVLRFLIKLQTFFTKKWFFDYFYYFVVKRIMGFSYKILFKNFDKGLFETIFVKEVIWKLIKTANLIRFKQTGQLTLYIMNIISIFFFFFVLLILMNNYAMNLILLFLFYGFYLIWKK